MIEAISSSLCEGPYCGLYLIGSLIAGFILGVGFFYTLWLTVQRIPTATNPGLLMFGSYLVRTIIIVGAFYFVMDGQWPRMVALIIGFILARLVVVRRTGQFSLK
jgi:F1F0 ATPase subunit 2